MRAKQSKQEVTWFAILVIFLSLSAVSAAAWTDTGGGDHGGADWTPANGATLCATHFNIGTFTVTSGYTVYVCAGVVLEVHAGTANIIGTINGDGKGYAGGAGKTCTGTPVGTGSGTGGGGAPAATDDGGRGPGGGGAGYGGAGGRAGGAYGSSQYGTGGAVYGSITDNTYLFGSGGGGGKGCCYSINYGTGGNGGNGGGTVRIIASTISVSGTISANGAAGTQPSTSTGCTTSYSCGGGGGGSGGTILLDGYSVTLSGILRANGGSGGARYGSYSGAGGGGAGGRIKISRQAGTTTGTVTAALGATGGTSYGTAAVAGIVGTINTGTQCTANGCACTLNSGCDSSNCKTDYDGLGSWCANSNQCTHDTLIYNNGDPAPNCADSSNRRYCNAGLWATASCGTDTCSGSLCPGCTYTDYFCASASCGSSVSDIDATQTLCNACKGSGFWSLGGDVDGTACCGDDSNELKLTKQCISGCTSDADDDACCNAATDCVDSSTCFSDKSFNGNLQCVGGQWYRKITVANAQISFLPGTERTTDNISLTFDVDVPLARNITDWRLNGKSIAVLNMPFDVNHSADGITRDFSTYENNGTVNGVVWQPSKVGQGYLFEGTSSIEIPFDDSLDFSDALTLSLWMNISQAEPERIESGSSTSCMIVSGGKALCWGANYFGQVGDGTAIDRNSPSLVAGNHAFKDISTGALTSCGVLTNGDAMCWGNNLDGDLGGGSFGDKSLVPSLVLGRNNFTQISRGSNFACALNSTGDIFCWGTNTYGQLGDGTTERKAMPTKVAGDHIFKGVTCGVANACGLHVNGSVYCWGRNYAGQLGDGTNEDKLVPTHILDSNLYSFIDCGGQACCGILTNQNGKCWGNNMFGQVGAALPPQYVLNPTPISGGHLFKSIEGGAVHTCALTMDNSMWCWGSNNDRELGDGTKTGRNFPVQVVGGNEYREISAGEYSSCGIAIDGHLSCWGSNSRGALGIGMFDYQTTPTGWWGDYQFSQVSITNTHSCGVLPNKDAMCWGYNPNGELGNSNILDSYFPVLVAGNHEFSSVTVGMYHSCGLLTNGSAYCWGVNSRGQLGSGTSMSSNTPVKAIGQLFQQIVSGGDSNCGLNLAGKVYCWGSNENGQLGNGDTIPRYEPTEVVGSITFTQISQSNDHVCGIDTSGKAWCWGYNAAGKIGDGTNEDKLVPTEVVGGHLFKYIAATERITCGVRLDGTRMCWGENSLLFGNGVYDSSWIPLAIDSLDFIEIGGDSTHICGILADQKAYCWGSSNGDGQIGDGTTLQRFSPVPVSGGFDFSDISIGPAMSCGIASGSLYCWGKSFYVDLRPGMNATIPGTTSGGVLLGQSPDTFAILASFGGDGIISSINGNRILTPISEGWHHAALTLKNGRMEQYIDGTATGNVNILDTVSPDSRPILIGQSISGQIDQVKMFSRALSHQQIMAEYLAESEGNPSNTLVSQETVKHDNWQAAVWATDGLSLSAVALSNILEVRNTPPHMTEPRFDKETYYFYTNITLLANYSDADNDTGTITFEWFRNGETVFSETKSGVANGTIVNSTLTKDYLSPGDSISATAIAYDDEGSEGMYSVYTSVCYCNSTDPCCSPNDCSWMPENSQPKDYLDDPDGFCTGEEGVLSTSYAYIRDYFCGISHLPEHTDTLADTCGICKFCTDNSLSCSNYVPGTGCGETLCPEDYCVADMSYQYAPSCTKTCNNGACEDCTCTPTPDDCSDDCSCACGNYNLASEIGFCGDGKDNDCDGMSDYDSSDGRHGDSDCPVEVIGMDMSESCAREFSTIQLNCTVDSPGVNSIGAKLGESECAFQRWNEGTAVFTCTVGGFTTEQCGTGNSYESKCFIQKDKSYQTGTNKTIAVYAIPSSCVSYSQSNTCDNDAMCDWCPECSSTKWSGLPGSMCVNTGTCQYNCELGRCTAVCDQDVGGCSATGCYGDSYVVWGCTAGCSCQSTPDDCSDCSCSCGDYKLTSEVGFCDDGKDNDCDQKTDMNDIDCNTPPNAPSSPSPADRENNVPRSTELSVLVSDPDGDRMNVTFYNAYTGEILGVQRNVASGERASISVSGLSKGSIFKWNAGATDKWGATTYSSIFGLLTLSPDEDWAFFNCRMREWTAMDNYNRGRLGNFTVLLRLNATKINYSRTDEEDVRFYDGGLLPHEIELWNEGGESLVWVKMPVMESTNSEGVWIYFNCSDHATENPAGSWAKSYVMVQHFDEGSGRYVYDSTSSSNTGEGASIAFAQSMIGGGISLPGNMPIATLTSSSLNIANEITIEMWVNSLAITSPSKTLFGKGVDAYHIGLLDNQNIIGYISFSDVQASLSGGWQHIAMSYKDGSIKLYINGELADQNSIVGSIGTNNNDLLLGDGVSGKLDEVRVSNKELSSQWIRGSYRNANEGIAWFGKDEVEDFSQITLNTPQSGDETVPPITTRLNVTVANRYGLDMTVGFYNSSDDSLIAEFTGVKNHTSISTMWAVPTPKQVYKWYVKSRTTIKETRSRTWNFTTLGFRVTGLPTGVEAFPVGSPLINLSQEYVYGAKNVMLSKSGADIANLSINFLQEVDLSGIAVDLDSSKSLVFIARTGRPYASPQATLRIPAINSRGVVYICPDAISMSQVNESCSNRQLLTGLTPTGGYYLVKLANGGGLEVPHPSTITLNSPHMNALLPPMQTTLNVSVSNVAGASMWVRFFDGDENFLGEEMNVASGGSAAIPIDIPEPNKEYTWRVTVSSPIDTNRSSFWSFSTEGYRISGVQSQIALTLVDDESKDLTAIYSYGVQNVLLKDSGVPVANFSVNFSRNIDFSDVIGVSNPAESTALLFVNKTLHTEIQSNFTLRVPVTSNSGAVMICPNAKSPEEISSSCSGVRLVERLVNRNGYYHVPITSAGGGEVTEVVYKSLLDKPGAYALSMAPIGGKLRGEVNNESLDFEFPTPLEWHQYAATYDGSMLRLFIDGKQVAAKQFSGPINITNTEAWIGEHFSGLIDEVKVFGKGIPASEVERLYQEGINERLGIVDYATTSRKENWSARVWVSDGSDLSMPVYSNTVYINKTCPENECGIEDCGIAQYGVYNASSGCALTCYNASDNQFACTECNSFNWSASASTCCGDGGVSDSFCSLGSDSCVAGVYFERHCFDGVANCDEADIDCNGTVCGACGINFEVDTRTTKYLRAPAWDVVTWKAKVLGSQDYAVNFTPIFRPKFAALVKYETKVQKLLFDHIDGITELYFNTRSLANSNHG